MELAVPKANSNVEILSKLTAFRSGTVDGIVFSDKAGGLGHFCEAEDIVQRNLVTESKQKLKETGNGIEVWNVLRTGDRCRSKLQSLVNELQGHGSTGFLFVSGHDYRTSLLERAFRGEKCSKDCAFRKGEESVLCGNLSSELIREGGINVETGRKKGLVLNRRYEENEPNVDFHITQACPPLVTEAWLETLHIDQLKSGALYMTIIPALSFQGLERIKALGSDIPLELLRKELDVKDPKRKGIKLAKESMQICARQSKLAGFYLYSHDTSVLVELASFAQSL